VVCSWVAMHTLPELARVPSAPPRAVSPVIGLRRVCLARPLTLAVTSLLLLQPAYAQKRRDAILQLRDDVSTAMAHANLTQKQIEKLDHCRQTLLLAAQSGRVHKAASKRDLDAAVKDIERAFQSGRFQADDRDLVRQDIAQLRAIERDQQVKRARR
jgi:hypothetical protein